MSKKFVWGLFFLFLAAVFLISVVRGRNQPIPAGGKLDDFARCLTERGAVMYGTNLCPHCQAQKELLGPSFAYVRYIDCFADTAACQAANIGKIPAWDFPDGTRILGTQPLENLSQKTGCPLE
jgi:glutaredoxin